MLVRSWVGSPRQDGRRTTAGESVHMSFERFVGVAPDRGDVGIFVKGGSDREGVPSAVCIPCASLCLDSKINVGEGDVFAALVVPTNL